MSTFNMAEKKQNRKPMVTQTTLTKKTKGDTPLSNRLYAALNTDSPSNAILLSQFSETKTLLETSLEQRMIAAVHVFINLMKTDGHKFKKLDKLLIDYLISQIDEALNDQMDKILHHSDFQQLESIWRGLKYLVDNIDFSANTKIEILDVDKTVLQKDFEYITDVTSSGLYKHLYIDEYDTPGGEPFTAMIANYEFTAGAHDVDLLKSVSKIAGVTHCPFIASAGAGFFQKEEIAEVTRIENLGDHLERAEYIRWNVFRESEDARYIGLTLPRFLLRLPYGQDNPVRQFQYYENVTGRDSEKYLWGNASFAFGVNMARSFKYYGWTVNIRGPESGGKVANLPLHHYHVGGGLLTKIPTEMIIPETRELELSNLGFVPISYYKNSDFACFFSANSVQKPAAYLTAEATANARINARLPYILLSSRLAHYLKVLQRENIGSNKSSAVLEKELNDWLQTLITKMNNPGPELTATHPLRDGKVMVQQIKDNPGFYQVLIFAMPHFQIEGVNVNLSLVSQMPSQVTV